MGDFLNGLKKTFDFLDSNKVQKIYQTGSDEEIAELEAFLSSSNLVADPKLYETVESCIMMLNHSINNIRYVPEDIQDNEDFRFAFIERINQEIIDHLDPMNAVALAYDDEESAKRKVINSIVQHITSDSLKLYVLLGM
jgi:hypothetical protein